MRRSNKFTPTYRPGIRVRNTGQIGQIAPIYRCTEILGGTSEICCNVNPPHNCYVRKSGRTIFPPYILQGPDRRQMGASKHFSPARRGGQLGGQLGGRALLVTLEATAYINTYLSFLTNSSIEDELKKQLRNFGITFESLYVSSGRFDVFGRTVGITFKMVIYDENPIALNSNFTIIIDEFKMDGYDVFYSAVSHITEQIYLAPPTGSTTTTTPGGGHNQTTSGGGNNIVTTSPPGSPGSSDISGWLSTLGSSFGLVSLGATGGALILLVAFAFLRK